MKVKIIKTITLNNNIIILFYNIKIILNIFIIIIKDFIKKF